MNIFALSDDPYEAAEFMHDKHVVKMTLESAQLLCAALAAKGGVVPYKTTHKNHPSTLWTGENLANWYWLHEHCFALNNEFKHRFSGADHKSWLAVKDLYEQADRLLLLSARTPFPQAMPDQYRGEDSIEAYRRYYVGEKMNNQKWTKRDVPKWATA